MSKLDILKGANEILTSIGVSAIVGNVIKMTADPDAGKIKKVAIAVGGFVLSSMVADKAVDYGNERIDATAKTFSRVFKTAEDLWENNEKEDAEEEIATVQVEVDPAGHVFLDGIDITEAPQIDKEVVAKTTTKNLKNSKKDAQ